MNRLKFLHRWLLLLALASILTSCLPLQVDLAATPSPQKSLTPVFTSTSTSEPTLIPSGTPTATLTPTALPLATPTLTPKPPPFTGLVPPGARARLSKGSIQHLIISPDGKAVAIGSSVTVCLYQVVEFNKTWCSLAESPSPGGVESLAFDPQGKSLAAGLANGDIFMWDAASGVQQLIIHASIANGIRSLAWSPDGSRLASGADDKCISLWDGHSGKLLDSFRPCESDIFSLRWSPDGSMIAAGDFWGQVIVRDAQSGSKLWSQKELQGYFTYSLAWSPDSSLVAAGSGHTSCWGEGPCTPVYAGDITVWDAHSGQQTRQIDAAMQVNAVAFNPDGTQLFAGLDNHEIRLYRLADGAVIQTLADVDASKGAIWFPDGKRLLTSNGVDTLIVWEVPGGKRSEVPLNGYAQLFGLAWSPDSARLVTSSYQGTIFIWDNATGQLLRKFDGERMSASPVAWSPDGKQIASSGSQGVIIWDAATGKRQQVLAVSNINLHDLSWSLDGRYFAALSPDDGITLWDAHSWLVLKTMNKIGYAVAMAWSPDGKTLATAGMSVFLWDTASGQQVGVLGQDTATFAIAWSPDGSKIAAASGGWAVIWDVKTGQDLLQATMGHSFFAQSVALSPDGQILASAAGEVILRDARNGEILQTLEGHSDADRLAFSPDGKTLASGSADGTVILWKNPLAGTNPKNGESNGPSLSADGRLIVFTSLSKDLVDETLPVCPTPDGQGIPCSQTYLFDRQTGSMELISRGEDGKPANGPTSGMISRDGQKVLLVSQATNLSSQGQSGLYLLDRATRAIKFVGAGGHPALSGDGRLVVFEKTNQKMSFDEIYLYDDQAGTTQNLSNGSSGENADGESMLPAISADDQWVAFWSWSSQIVTKIPGKCTVKGPNASCGDVYLKNLRTGKTDRIAVDEPYGEGMISYPISLSNDARWVAFKGAIYDHQTGEPILQYCLPEINCAGGTLSRDGQWVVYAKAGDIFIQNRSGGRPEQASVSSEGTPGNGSSIDSIACESAPGCSRYPKFDLSADGRLVVFDSTASNLVPGDNRMCDDKVSILHNCQDIFLRDRQTGKTEWISKP
jgi:WD40 repeat protein